MAIPSVDREDSQVHPKSRTTGKQNPTNRCSHGSIPTTEEEPPRHTDDQLPIFSTGNLTGDTILQKVLLPNNSAPKEGGKKEQKRSGSTRQSERRHKFTRRVTRAAAKRAGHTSLALTLAIFTGTTASFRRVLVRFVPNADSCEDLRLGRFHLPSYPPESNKALQGATRASNVNCPHWDLTCFHR